MAPSSQLDCLHDEAPEANPECQMVASYPQPRHNDENKHVQHVRNTHTLQPQMGRSSHQARQYSAAKANPLLPAQGRTSKRWQAKTPL